MASFALFRLPRERACTLMIQREGEPQELLTLSELNRKSGFVIAPFAITAQQPVLLLGADETRNPTND